MMYTDVLSFSFLRSALALAFALVVETKDDDVCVQASSLTTVNVNKAIACPDLPERF